MWSSRPATGQSISVLGGCRVVLGRECSSKSSESAAADSRSARRQLRDLKDHLAIASCFRLATKMFWFAITIKNIADPTATASHDCVTSETFNASDSDGRTRQPLELVFASRSHHHFICILEQVHDHLCGLFGVFRKLA